MRKEYRNFALRLTMVTTFSCAVAMRGAWLVPSCYATTSEAQQEADLKVSLSAEKIIEILRQEPGLLLQVKRMLIQKAYEQGRILESSDLTDDALFRLLREDDVVRALATREVEYRFYVRAKPTRRETESKRAEVDNDQDQGPEPDRAAPKSSTSDLGQRPNGQEDAYWSEQQRNNENDRKPRSGAESPLRPDRDPEISVPRNPARAVDRTELEQNPNIFENIGSDASRMARIHPEELAGLLNVTSPASPQLRESESTAFQLSPQVGRITRNSSTMDFPERMSQRSQQASLVSNRPPIPKYPGVDDVPLIRHRPNPYNDVPSLYDLYSQVSRRSPQLERFGMAIFRNGTYVLGPGDDHSERTTTQERSLEDPTTLYRSIS
jgi:hypothetical protein